MLQKKTAKNNQLGLGPYTDYISCVRFANNLTVCLIFKQPNRLKTLFVYDLTKHTKQLDELFTLVKQDGGAHGFEVSVLFYA